MVLWYCLWYEVYYYDTVPTTSSILYMEVHVLHRASTEWIHTHTWPFLPFLPSFLPSIPTRSPLLSTTYTVHIYLSNHRRGKGCTVLCLCSLSRKRWSSFYLSIFHYTIHHTRPIHPSIVRHNVTTLIMRFTTGGVTWFHLDYTQSTMSRVYK